MPTPPRKPSAGEEVRCPQCGATCLFAVYETTIRVHHLEQHEGGCWKHTGATPRRLHTRIPGLMVCESCAHPLGIPPEAVLKVIPKRR